MCEAISSNRETDEIRDLKRQILNLQIQLDAERERAKNLKGGALLNSEPIDLYPGEQLDFVLRILEQARERCPEDSRPRDIIDSLLAVNKPIGKGEEILTTVSSIFRAGIPEKASDIAELERMGFSYTPSRKHPKLRFHTKYMIVLPSTSSDSRCASRNSLSEINKCIAISQKI